MNDATSTSSTASGQMSRGSASRANDVSPGTSTSTTSRALG